MSASLSRVLRGGLPMCLAALLLPGCAAAVRTDSASSYLIIDALEASSGAKPDTFDGTLASDVLTKGTIYEDDAKVTLRLGMKDPGTATTPTTPSSANYITISQYHVSFVRSDGRNTPGVDVPYAFDGAVTVTVGASVTTAILPLVRVQAKDEAPLKALVGGNGALAISTIAEVTFYGKDQTGRAVSVVGHISVNFADWGDPA